MDDLTLWSTIFAFYLVYKLGVTFAQPKTVCVPQETNNPTPKSVKEHVTQQSEYFGWALSVTKVGIKQYNCEWALEEPAHNEQEVRELSTVVLLNWLRDHHPDPNVADKSAELILALGRVTREIQ